jgi:hypothetical protein
VTPLYAAWWPRSLCAAALTLAPLLGLGLGVGGCDADDDGDSGGAATGSDASSGDATASTTGTTESGAGTATTGSGSETGATTATTSAGTGTASTAATATTEASTDATSAGSDTAASATTTAGTDGTGGSGPVTPPAEPAALLEYLRTGEYRQWRAEPAPHPSDGPHFGDVQIYVNDALFDSLSAGATVHPVGSTAIKELYGSGPNVRGWAVEIKTGDEPDGDGWFWYERYDGDVFAQSNGAGICTGCHSDGTDYVFVSAAALQ